MSEQNDKNKKEIRVTVDNEQTKSLALELAQEKIKNEKLVDRIAGKEVKEDHDDLAEKKLQAIAKFGRPDLFLQADTKEKLSAIMTSYINELAERANPTQKAGGTAPANAQQYGIKSEDLYTRKFLDSQEMVSELRRLSKEGTPQEKADSEHYLNELWKKYVLDKRANPTRSEPSQNPNTPEALSELDLVQKDGFLTPRNKEDGDLGALQRKWRLERKRKMREGSESE